MATDEDWAAMGHSTLLWVSPQHMNSIYWPGVVTVCCRPPFNPWFVVLLHLSHLLQTIWTFSLDPANSKCETQQIKMWSRRKKCSESRSDEPVRTGHSSCLSDFHTADWVKIGRDWFTLHAHMYEWHTSLILLLRVLPHLFPIAGSKKRKTICSKQREDVSMGHTAEPFKDKEADILLKTRICQEATNRKLKNL